MQAHTVERVESWDSRPFSGGFRELHDLADANFSGAVVADGTWLFVLNGRVIGVFEGDIEDFEDADGTVYEAPDPSVALLFSMQERGGQTQAKYYSNDTPLSEADDTLSSANFTGYVELSENVLSGDYYVVYYGGRSMSAAFVGTSEELITGDEAFERADDEVGVYEVMKTPVNVTALPEVEDEDESEGEPTDAAAGAAAAGGAAAGAAAAGGAAASDDSPAAAESSPATEQSTGGESRTEATSATDQSPSSSGTGAASSSTTDTAAAGATAASTGDADTGETTVEAPSGSAGGDAGGDESPEGRAFDEEQEWQNARSVPTLDPEKSATSDGGTEAASGSSSNAPSRSEQSKRTQRKRSTQSRSKRSANADQQSSSGKPRSTVEKLKQAVKRRDAKLEETKERLATLEGERDDLRETVEEVERERDELQSRVDELEAELAAVEADQPDGDLELDRSEALSGTNLFVRYDSKGKPTLDELDGSTNREEVNQNLRIDHHTQFEASRATVDGESFESFLADTAAYRFVSWAVRELPYEIRDSGHQSGLADLYDAIPDVDRAELDGTVEVETEDGAVAETFDVVLRDRMGNPLVVAELNAEREPVTGDEMQSLVDAATGVREGSDDLGAAVYVTASFFEPPALETAAEETGGGGFLSRSDKESYVKVARKAGYHLCLVEDRSDAFHLTVPEL
ncbi:DUF7527 domain-containing protein [Halobacterium litoreum]|uniref:DUF7527 domain-containing protein n=1 Tax=Halobacterium litoreum TaxID=2039234 RepID=A0ABD5NBI4_9EURY|nr:hypothetical protein [Halobacterium litoreum]UHH14704.1 hypothetical protein LT972_06805 [Halobacterium litoreum]